MAIEAARLVVNVDADTAKAQAALRGMDGQVQKTAQGMESGAKSVSKFDDAALSAAESFTGFSLGATGGALALAAFGKSAFDAASDMQESMNKVDVVFGNSADSVKAFADDAATNLGLSEQAALAATGTFGNMLTAMGFTGDAAADMSQDIVSLAADLGSFNNIGTAEALEKIRAGLVGETEPLRSLGVNLTAAAVEAKALELGLAGTTKELTAADKAQASYALILEQTTSAQGDFARTADGAANSVKTARASFEDLQATLGAGLVPVVAKVAQDMTALIGILNSVGGGINDLVTAIPGLSGEASFLSSVIDSMNPGLVLLTDGSKFAGEGFGWMKDQMGLAGDEASTLAPLILSVADAIETATGKGNIFEVTLANIKRQMEDTAETATEVADVLAKLNNESEAGGAALDKYGGAHGRAAERAGEMNERNTEALHSIELTGGAAAEAAYGLDQMSAATERAWAAQDQLNGIMSQAQGEVSTWEGRLSDAQSALEILDGEMAENGSLTVEQQRQYDLLTWAVGRYQGGVEDSEGAVVSAAEAQALFIQTQDDLNAKLATGEITQSEYNRAMGAAAGAIDPATGAAYGLSAAQGDLQTAIEGVVNKLGNLLIDLGLLPESKRTEFTTPGMDQAQMDVDTLNEKVNAVPESMTITAYVDITQAQIALDDLRGMTFTQSPPKEGPMAFQPDFSYIFDGLPEAARDVGQRSMQNLADFLPMERAVTGPLTRSIDWSWLYVGLDTEAEDYAQRASEAIANHLSSIDLDSILDTQGDLGLEIANLEALQTALREIGDTAGVEALNGEIAALRAEYAALVTLISTDAVQAWITNADAAKLAAEAAAEALRIQQDAAEAALDAQREFDEEQARLQAAVIQRAADAQQAVMEGLAAGGDATGQFFERIVADAEAAQEAFDLGRLLGVSPEALAALAENLTEAEVQIGAGTAALREALLGGLVDESTLQALAAAGGEWFEALYDQLFGPGALDAVSAGWNDITDASLEQIQLLISEMEDGGAEIVDTLVDAVAGGAISYEEALSLLGDATGEEVNAILDELQRLYDALLVDLANALVTGSDPSEIEANMAAIEALMESLSDKAIETADKVVKAGKSMAAGYSAALDEMAGTGSQDSGSSGSSGGSSRRGGLLTDGMNNPGFNSLDLNGDGIISEKEQIKAFGAPIPAGYRWGLPDLPPPAPILPPAPTPRSYDRSRDERGGMSDAQFRQLRDAVREGAREGTSSGFTGWQIPVGR